MKFRLTISDIENLKSRFGFSLDPGRYSLPGCVLSAVALKLLENRKVTKEFLNHPHGDRPVGGVANMIATRFNLSEDYLDGLEAGYQGWTASSGDPVAEYRTGIEDGMIIRNRYHPQGTTV